MAKKSKKAKRGAPARTKKRMKATRKKKPVPNPVAPSLWEGFAGAKKEKKPTPKPGSPPDAASVWEGFGGKTENH